MNAVIDYLAFVLAISTPLALLGAAADVLLGGPLWVATFLGAYGLTSLFGTSRLLWEFYRHGIHNKHFCGGADCHGYTGRYQ